jgi:hypothetical protein
MLRSRGVTRSHDHLTHTSRPHTPCHRRSHAPPHPRSPKTTRPSKRTSNRQARWPLRRRHRRTRAPFPANHLASHGHPHQSGVGRRRQTGPVALVPPQRKSPSPISEEPADPTVKELWRKSLQMHVIPWKSGASAPRKASKIRTGFSPRGRILRPHEFSPQQLTGHCRMQQASESRRFQKLSS